MIGKKSEVVSPEWWGSKYGFISGGFLGAQSTKRKSIRVGDTKECNERTAFFEEDQENLYKLVQDKATAGKQGLGIKDRPKKIAGVHFQGKKTSFGNSDDEDLDDNDDSANGDVDFADSIALAEQNNDNMLDVKIVGQMVEQEGSGNIGSSRKRKCENALETEDIGEQKVRLKKLCKHLLRQVLGNSLKLKKLKVLIEEHAPSAFSNFSSKRDALAYLKEKLEGSRNFSIEGKRVSLASRGR
uniref:Uncharacterized protein LOC105124331 isoform X2 n=1 Tax=Rhizophora mucronata TaxID=61149 RepID=A0A2P2KY93_RHIMU